MMTEANKKKGLLVACVALCLFGSGCSTMRPLRYTSAIVNEGRQAITVEPFELADAPEATVAVGDVLPTGRKSMSPYYCRPKSILNLTWRLLQTGEERQAHVIVDLPKEFTKERGSAIVFHIKPEEGTVEVTYEILDPRTGVLSIIRQGERPPASDPAPGR
jgi:hypothetical protein